MSMILKGFLLAMAIFSLAAFAAPGDGAVTPAPDEIYDCQMILIAKDLLSGSATFKYEVNANNGPHGGQEYPFSSGNYKISVLSNGRWMGISWWRGEELIAES